MDRRSGLPKTAVPSGLDPHVATAAELFYIPTANRLSVVSVQTKPSLTFSSGLLNALTLKDAPSTVLVGEPTGGKPNHYGQVASLVLPRSGLRVSYSTRFFSSPITTPPLNPDIHVPFSSSAFFQNRDPYLDTAMQDSSNATAITPFVIPVEVRESSLWVPESRFKLGMPRWMRDPPPLSGLQSRDIDSRA